MQGSYTFNFYRFLIFAFVSGNFKYLEEEISFGITTWKPRPIGTVKWLVNYESYFFGICLLSLSHYITSN